LFNWFVRARDWYFSQPRWKFEAVTLGVALGLGLLVMPALIYLVGRLALREYANGGLFALYFDFYKRLFQFEPGNWIVVAGPFGFLTFTRIFRWVLRKL
jgi:hypothetical protein